MNKFPAVTIIAWQTRNWRHHKKALLWSRDYGLTPLTGTVHIGKLYARERAVVQAKFKSVFTKETEKFSMITICHSCFDTAEINDTIKRTAGHTSDFEFIQFPEITNKRRLLHR